jgi:hypothetical protein
MPKKFINTDELSRLIGIEPRRIKDWRRLGMPYRSAKYGSQCKYSPVECYQWMMSAKHFAQAANLKKYMDFPPYEKTQMLKPPENNTVKTVLDGDETDDAVAKISDEELDRFTIYDSKRLLAKILIEAEDGFKKSSTAEKAAAATVIKTISEIFRKTEVDCIDIDRTLKKLMPVEEAKKYIYNIFNRVRTDLRTLPFALSNELAAATASEPQIIVAIIKPKIDDALRHLGETLNYEQHQDDSGDIQKVSS